ncbi:hypothetical protein RSAG8_05288, partial [Rhizoctonia solani AG-8 WAC10335]
MNTVDKCKHDTPQSNHSHTRKSLPINHTMELRRRRHRLAWPPIVIGCGGASFFHSASVVFRGILCVLI